MASRVLRQRGTGVSVRIGRRTQAEKDKDSKKREKKSRSSSKKETLAQEVARKTGKTVTSVRGGVGREDTKEVVRTTARGQERTVGRITSQDGRRTLVRERGGDPRTLRTAVKLETQLQAREKPTEFKRRTEETARVARVRQERLSRGAPIRAKDIIPRGQAVPLTRENITAVRQIAAEQARRIKQTQSQREIIEQIRERGIVKRVDPFARVTKERPTIPLQKRSPQESFLPEQTTQPEIVAPQIERPQSTLERLESPQEVAAKEIRPFTGRRLSTKLATTAIFLGVKGEELVGKISQTAETKEGTVAGILAGSSTVAIGAGKAFIETGELIGAIATKTGRARIATGLGEFMKDPIVNIQKAGLEFGAELRRRPGEQIGRFGADIVADVGVAKAGKAGLSLVGRVADVIDPRFANVIRTSVGTEEVRVLGKIGQETFVDEVAGSIAEDALRGLPKAGRREIPIQLIPEAGAVDVDLAKARELGIDISQQQARGGFGFSLKEQAEVAGKTGDVATAQRDLFSLVRREVTIEKPLPTPDSPELERALFASPFEPDTGAPQLRKSRLMTDTDKGFLSPEELLTADIQLKEPRRQIVVFERQTVAELPKDLKTSIGAGRQLTPSQQKQLLEFQLKPTGQFKPIGFTSSEAELVLSPGETIQRRGSLGRTRIGGKSVEIISADIVPETPKQRAGRLVFESGGISEEQYRRQLAKQTGLDFSRSVERRAVVTPVEIGAFIGTRATRETSKIRSTDVGIGIAQPQARRLFPEQIQSDIISRPRARDPIRITSIPIRPRSTARDIEIVRQPKRVARRPARITEPIFRPEPRRMDPRPVRTVITPRPPRRPIDTPYRPDRIIRPDITPPPNIFDIPKVRARPKALKKTKTSKKKKRKEKGFSPTFFAAFGNIRGFEKEGVAQTGLSIRPIGKPAKFSIKF